MASLRTKICNTQRTLKEERSTHKLTPDRLKSFVRQRPFVNPGYLCKNSFFTIRNVYRSIGSAFQLSDFDDDLRAFVEQLDEMRVDRVYLFS